MKTVLAPNAPWPMRDKPQPKPKPAPRKYRATKTQTDVNYDRWLANTFKKNIKP